MSLLGRFFGRRKAKQFESWEKTVAAHIFQPVQETRRYLENSEYLLPKDK